MHNLELYRYLPKGLAYSGTNFLSLINSYSIVIAENILQPLLDFQQELSIDTASYQTILLMFNEINTRNLFPQVLNEEDFRLILKLFKLTRRWITRDDIIDIMKRIKYSIEFLDPVEVFNNPSNYLNLEYYPQSLEEAYFILYYKLSPIQEGDANVFPIPFPIIWDGQKRRIADRLIAEIVDATILLVSYQ